MGAVRIQWTSIFVNDDADDVHAIRLLFHAIIVHSMNALHSQYAPFNRTWKAIQIRCRCSCFDNHFNLFSFQGKTIRSIEWLSFVQLNEERIKATSAEDTRFLFQSNWKRELNNYSRLDWIGLKWIGGCYCLCVCLHKEKGLFPSTTIDWVEWNWIGMCHEHCFLCVLLTSHWLDTNSIADGNRLVWSICFGHRKSFVFIHHRPIRQSNDCTRNTFVMIGLFLCPTFSSLLSTTNK